MGEEKRRYVKECHVEDIFERYQEFEHPDIVMDDGDVLTHDEVSEALRWYMKEYAYYKNKYVEHSKGTPVDAIHWEGKDMHLETANGKVILKDAWVELCKREIVAGAEVLECNETTLSYETITDLKGENEPCV